MDTQKNLKNNNEWLQYVKKPAIIKAILFDGKNKNAVLMNELMHWGCDGKGEYISIKTLEGEMRARIGDWIIRGVEGEYYPCKDSVFRKTYQLEKEDN